MLFYIPHRQKREACARRLEAGELSGWRALAVSMGGMKRREVASFIAEVVPAAQATQQETGIPASITIAQAIMEYSALPAAGGEDRKYFGKSSAAEGFSAHAKLLSQRYSAAMRHTGSAVAFALALQACGYSKDPRYADKLIDLVDQFHLTQHDAPPSPPNEPAKAKRAA